MKFSPLGGSDSFFRQSLSSRRRRRARVVSLERLEERTLLAGNPFVTPIDSTIGSSTGEIQLADLNGDGKLDEVTVSETYPGSISVLLNDGTGKFSSAVSVTIPTGAESFAIGDFEGTGKPDIVVADGNGGLYLLSNNGHGVFSAPSAIPAPPSGSYNPTTQIIAGDFNGDGHVDLAYATNYPRGLNFLAGDGHGHFAAPVVSTLLSSSSYGMNIAAADFNNDGKLDLVTYDPTNTGTVTVYKSLGNGNFTGLTPVVIGGNLSGPEFAVGDLNGDGNLDVVVGGYGPRTDVLLGDGTGKLTPTTPISQASSSVALGDLNGDGKLDLVMGNTTGTSLIVANGVGNGTFATATESTYAVATSLVALGDVNGDHSFDVVSTDSGNNSRLILNDGAGNLLAPRFYADPASNGFSESPITGNFNGDGHPDVLIRTGTGADLALSDGHGGFSVPTLVTGLLSPNYLAAGDLNGDGVSDIIDVSGGTVVTYLNNGAGKFTYSSFFGISSTGSPNFTGVPILGDFNGDGKIDVAVPVYDSATQSGGIEIGFGNGAGGFSRVSTQLFPGLDPSEIRAGDIEGDGRQDIAMLDGNTGKAIEVLKNDGAGNFSVLSTVTLASVARDFLLGDFHQTGRLDIASLSATNSYTAGSVDLYANTGGGQFSPPASFALSALPFSFASADFNLDGNLDIAVSIDPNTDGPSGVFLAGNGNGSFTTTSFDPGPTFGAMAVADFNSDGSPDLVGVTGGDGIVVVNALPNVTSDLALSLPSTATAGTSVTFQVTAQLPSGLPSTTYAGTVHFTSSDPTATLPADYTFQPSDGGVHTFTLTMTTAGAQSLTIQDKALVNLNAIGHITIGVNTSSLSWYGKSGSPQTTPAGSKFGSPLFDSLEDNYGNPASGANVTFSAPTSGASLVLPGAGNTFSETLGSLGQAVLPPQFANTIPGSYLVTLTVAGSTASDSFSLTNSQVPAAITSRSSSLSTTVGTTFTSPFSVLVTDANGQPVPSATVTFYLNAPVGSSRLAGASFNGYGSGVYVPVLTDANGIANSPLIMANLTAGSYPVTATVTLATGLKATASTYLLNTPAAASLLVTSAGAEQSTIAGTAFATALQAQLLDPYNNPIANAPVTFTVYSGIAGVAATFPSAATSVIATTDASGFATAPTLTANTLSGVYHVTATTPGVSTQATFILVNAGVATTLTAESGGGQSALILNPFSSTFTVLVTDILNNPVAGASVTFVAPFNGASGTFAGGSSIDIETSNASGIATSGAFTANSVTGTYSISAYAPLCTQVSFSLTNSAPGAPAAFTLVAGTGQSAQVNSPFATPLKAVVTDASGHAVPNYAVTFAAPSGGLGGSFAGGALTATVYTDGTGLATAPTFTAGKLAESFTVSASAGPLAPLGYLLTTTPGAASSITATSGSSQSAQPNSAFSAPVTVLVRDAYGNAVPGASVTFTTPTSGPTATFSSGANSATAIANAGGLATAPPLTTGSTLGSFSVTATSGSAQSGVSMLVLGLPATLTVVGGASFSATVNTLYQASFAVLVSDASGNPVPNTLVKFSVPASGPSGIFGGSTTTVNVSTNAAGVATAGGLTANTLIGGFALTASCGSVTPVTFNLTNQSSGVAAAITKLAGDNQAASIGTTFATRLEVKVVDAFGNPVVGDQVVFTQQPNYNPSDPGGGLFATSPQSGQVTVVTDANGVATAPSFTALESIGTYQISAQPMSTGAPVNPVFFTLNNIAGAPTYLNYGVVTSAGQTEPTQSSQVGTQYLYPLAVLVRDAQYNPVPGSIVTFTATSTANGATGSFNVNGVPTTASTVQVVADGSGAAIVSFIANSVAGGPFTVTAKIGTIAPVSFSLTNTPPAGAPAVIKPVAGTPQLATVNTTVGTSFTIEVLDSKNIPVPYQPVTFTAPLTAASGTFAGSLPSYTVNTDKNGLASSSAYTTNGVAGLDVVSASVGGVASTANFSVTNTTNTPANVTITGGTGQTANVKNAFAAGVTLTVADVNGSPLSGAGLTFHINTSTSGASAMFPNGTTTFSAVSDAFGDIASPAPIANTVAGTYTIDIYSGGVILHSVSFINAPSTAANIVASTTSLSTQVGTAFPQFGVTVTDAYGNPVPNSNVTLSVVSQNQASATFPNGSSVISLTANANGYLSSATLTANGKLGNYQVQAVPSGLPTPAVITLTNLVGAPALINVLNGTNQSTAINSYFPQPIEVSVTDKFGNAISGVAISFVAQTGTTGSTAAFDAGPTPTTNANGIATAPPLRANATIGSFVVNASILGGSVSPALFTLSNTPLGAIQTTFSANYFTAYQNVATAPMVLAKFSDGPNPNPANYTVTVSTPDGSTLNVTPTVDSQGNLVVTTPLTFRTPGAGYVLIDIKQKNTTRESVATVPVVVYADVSNLTKVTLGSFGHNRGSSSVTQTDSVTNNSSSTIMGNYLVVVISNLVTTSMSFSSCNLPYSTDAAGNLVVFIPIPAGGLASGQSVSFTLTYTTTYTSSPPAGSPYSATYGTSRYTY